MNKKHYLEKGGLICPFCGSEDIGCVSSADLYSDRTYLLKAFCFKCDKYWYDILYLSDVVMPEEVSWPEEEQ